MLAYYNILYWLLSNGCYLTISPYFQLNIFSIGEDFVIFSGLFWTLSISDETRVENSWNNYLWYIFSAFLVINREKNVSWIAKIPHCLKSFDLHVDGFLKLPLRKDVFIPLNKYIFTIIYSNTEQIISAWEVTCKT